MLPHDPTPDSAPHPNEGAQAPPRTDPAPTPQQPGQPTGAALQSGQPAATTTGNSPGTPSPAQLPPPPGSVDEAHVATPWKKLRRNKVAMVSMFILILMSLAAFIGPALVPEEKRRPSEVASDQLRPPSAEYPLGTDLNRRDLMYRLLLGARISLGVGLAGALLSIVIGTGYGMIAGYAGGKVDAVMMRIVDILYSVPRLIVVLVLINALDPQLKGFVEHVYTPGAEHGVGATLVKGVLNLIGLGGEEHKGTADSLSRIMILIITLGLIEWLSMARIVRGQVLSLRERQFVTASRALGQSHFQIVVRHLLPNLMGIVITYLTLTIPAVILDESFLSFLGLGVQEPMSSWGSLLKDGSSNINPVKSFWWLLVFPAATMSITLLALNFLGDGLRDAYDPKGGK